jgi:phenylacetate-CoA ligase
MNSFVVRNLFYPLQECLKGQRTLRVLRFLEESQFWSPDKLASYRLERLKRFLTYAQENVPYYRALWRSIGFDLGSVADLRDIEKLPLLTRDVLQSTGTTLASKCYRGRTRLARTGGSTGFPVSVLVDSDRMAFSEAARIRCQKWFGVDIGDREIVIWGSPIELGRQDKLRTFRDNFLNTQLISAFDWTPRKMALALAKIAATKPVRIFGYAQSIALLAEIAREASVELTPCKAVFTTAEPLYDFQKEQIKILGNSVASEYGARDAGLIGQECPKGKLHLNAEGVLVEIIDREGGVLPEGEEGEIVVTNWDTPAMPIIRYATGDIGAFDTSLCTCGVMLPCLKGIMGRASDFLIGSDGRRIHPLGPIYALRDVQALKQFRIVQHSLVEVELQLVVRNPLTSSDRELIQKRFDKLMNSSVTITFTILDCMPTATSGKFRYVESKLSPVLLGTIASQRGLS